MSSFAQRLIVVAAATLTSLAAWGVPDIYPTPGTQAPVSSFSATASGQLVAYYTGEAGGFTNMVGLRLNGVDGPAGLDNHASAYGATFVMGTVNLGDTLVFFIDANMGSPDAARYYTDVSLNADGVNHAWANPYAGDAQVPAGNNLAFEDLPSGGDFNYRDHSFVYSIVPVPEPAQWALMLAGVCGLSLLKKRRR